MKSASMISPKIVASAFALALLAGLPASALAATSSWNGGSGTWDDGVSTGWNTGTWTNGNDAYFNIAPAGTLTVGSNLSVASLTFDTGATSAYTFDNSGGYDVTFTGAGILKFGNPGVQHTILNTGAGNLTFGGASGLANTAIDNTLSTVNFTGASTGGAGSSISNSGGSISLVGHDSSPVTIGTVTNTGALFGGGTIDASKTTLALSTLTLDTSANTLNFDLTNGTGGPSATGNGKITISDAFTGFTPGGVSVSFTSGVPVLAGTYALIDWTGTGANPSLSDFTITNFSPNLATTSHLVINGNELDLVAVPEPATFAMPMAACLGLLMLRRRAARLAV